MNTGSSKPTKQILTIGHSNHTLEHFVGLLKQHNVEVVADTRSYPQSKYASQFDSKVLKRALSENGIKYLFMGKELGGRPPGSEYYDHDGHVLYARVAESAFFQNGLKRLEKGLGQFRVAMLCTEENPAPCHRRLLVGRVLAQKGISIAHIRGDGRLQSEAQLTEEESLQAGHDRQLSFFNHWTPEWKSIPSVLHKKRLSSSSAR